LLLDARIKEEERRCVSKDSTNNIENYKMHSQIIVHYIHASLYTHVLKYIRKNLGMCYIYYIY